MVRYDSIDLLSFIGMMMMMMMTMMMMMMMKMKMMMMMQCPQKSSLNFFIFAPLNMLCVSL